MATPPRQTGFGWMTRSRMIVASAVALLLVAAASLFYWLAVPRIADALLRERLAGLEQRAGLQADFSAIETSAFEGVTLRDFELRRSSREVPFASVAYLKTSLELYPLLFGTPVLDALEVREATLHVRRLSDGSTNLQRIRAELRDRSRGDGSDAESAPPPDGDETEGPPAFLRYFGGEWPSLQVRDAEIRFGGERVEADWPISRIGAHRVEVVSSGQTARASGELAVEQGPGAHPLWTIPDAVDFDGQLRVPLADSTGRLEFDSPLEVVGLGPLPYLRTGLGELAVTDGRTVELRDASLGVQTGGAPSSVGNAERIAVSFDEWPSSPTDFAVEEVVLEQPTLVADIDRQHASGVHDLIQLLRAPRARHVHDRAHAVARSMYLDIPEWRRPDLDDADRPAPDEKPGLAERLRKLVSDRLLAASVPDRLEIADAEVHLTDRRRMGLVAPTRELGLRDGRLVLEHDVETGRVTLEAGFDAYAGDKPSPGSLSAELDGNYRRGTLETDLELTSLDLSWLSQMLGARSARRIKGGRLKAKLETSRDSESGRHPFSGYLALQEGVFELDAVAADPIDGLDLGYYFEGHYAPDAEMPELQHLVRRDLRPDDAPSPDEQADAGSDAGRDAGSGPSLELPTRGAFVLTSGEAELNGVTASFRPAVYGFESLQQMPTRLDVAFELEETEVQQIFEAVPEAIRGPTTGTEMAGSFAWTFDVEIPLHDAGEMEWKTQPELTDFELLELPEKVDVRKLRRGFSHVIRDDNLEFERNIEIPPMRPVETSWILEHGLVNSEVDLEELDERRRRRRWPPLPPRSQFDDDQLERLREAAETYDDLGRDPSPLEVPEVWTSEPAEAMAAPKPWREDEPLGTVDPDEIPDDRDPIEWVRDQIARAESDPARIERGTVLYSGQPPDDLESMPTRSVESDDADSPDAPASGPTFSSAWRSGLDSSETDADSSRSDDDDRSGPALDSSVLVRRKQRDHIHPYGPYVYVPLHHLSKWLPRAIMTTEDNSFFEHTGFNWYALQESVEDNLQAGGFVRGASTVSMQLVKNVFLSFDKVLARKIREAFLVWLMEDVVDVPKARIMELYFNIIEFGPGIFGIHDASVHYFGKRPDELSLGEVLWLVSVVPNPKKHHRFYERGNISDAWLANLVSYADIMWDRDRAKQKDVERVEQNRPEFYKPESGEPKLRPDEPSGPSVEDFSTIFE